MSIPVHDSVAENLLRQILQELQAATGFLSQIQLNTRPSTFTVQVVQLQGDKTMAIGSIAPGSTGQFGAQLLNNGTPVANFTGTFTFTTSDPGATIAPATTDASGGTIPLANQVIVSIPTGDTLGSVTVTATTTDPAGKSQSGALTVAIGTVPPPNNFSVGVVQLA